MAGQCGMAPAEISIAMRMCNEHIDSSRVHKRENEAGKIVCENEKWKKKKERTETHGEMASTQYRAQCEFATTTTTRRSDRKLSLDSPCIWYAYMCVRVSECWRYSRFFPAAKCETKNEMEISGDSDSNEVYFGCEYMCLCALGAA